GSWNALSLCERNVGDGEFLDALLERHGPDAEQAAQFARWNQHRAGRRRSARYGLREGRRARGMEGHIALHLLHQLVDMAVKNGDRAEGREQAERLRRILRAP